MRHTLQPMHAERVERLYPALTDALGLKDGSPGALAVRERLTETLASASLTLRAVDIDERVPKAAKRRARHLLTLARELAGEDATGLWRVGVVRSPDVAYKLMAPTLEVRDRETLVCLCLNTQHHPLALLEVSTGTLNSSMVHPREVFRAAMTYPTAGVIIGHNHPSGDPTPSIDDREVAKMLFDAGDLLGIPVRDFLIVGRGRYTSFVELGLTPTPTRRRV